MSAAAPLLFLSHAGQDLPAAQSLALHLRAAGLRVWLDADHIRPGDSFQHEIIRGLRDADAFLLYVGRAGVARWVDFEVQLACARRVERPQFRIIPILGPGSEPAALPDFVKLFHWVDLREDRPDPERLKVLVTTVLDEPAKRARCSRRINLHSKDCGTSTLKIRSYSSGATRKRPSS